MCDICVMNTVKDKMLSRRDLFKTGAAGAAATVTASAISPSPVIAAGHGRVEDMTHELHEDFPTYFGKSQFSRKQVFNHAEHGFSGFVYTIDEHTGTHIDAPLHFAAGGQSVAEIPVSNLIAPLCVIDIADRAEADPDTQVTPDDIKAWISANGDVPQNACVAMHSGWGRHVNTDKFRNADGDGTQHYPGFHGEAAKMLMEETTAASIAVDTLSLDHGASQDFATHFSWLPSGRFGIECIANLDKMPASGATLVVGAPKVKDGTGACIRHGLIAVIPFPAPPRR
ncbi:MAG: cyclase family protein [Rhizobiaceae bacterium]